MEAKQSWTTLLRMGAAQRRMVLSLYLAFLVVVVGASSALASYGGSTSSRPSPRAHAKATRTSWVAELVKRAKTDPKATFRNLPNAVFFARLRRLQVRYHFQLVEARMLHPIQAAPLLIVQARDPQGFSHDVPAIQRALDPKRRTNDDRTGWAYEGFYLEARDTRGTPFLAIFNYWRGPHAGGGQWAAAPNLDPFAHG